MSFPRMVEQMFVNFVRDSPLSSLLVSSKTLLRWPFMSCKGSLGDISYL